MRILVRLLLSIHLLAISACPAVASERSLSAMRQTFLQAERYIKQHRDNDYFALSDTLKNYPLYPYLHYQWLIKHLDDNAAIQSFLHDYPHTRYATLLHGKWLANLGNKQQWFSFIRQYKITDNTELQCYFAQAQYQMGEQQRSMEKAKQLWLSGKSQPAACDPLFERLQNEADFESNWVWQRFEAALGHNNTQLAKQILPLLPESQRKMAETWLQLHHQPQRVKDKAAWKRNDSKAGLLFAHAIRRWLDSDPQAALQVWDAEKKRFNIPAELVADIEKRLGLELAFRRDSRAYQRLSQHAGNDPSAQEWRVRAALSQQNWQNVLLALDALDDTLKRQDKWQYWRAKALSASQQHQQAQAILSELAKQRSFYGFMAAEQLQQPIALNHHPITVSDHELNTLQQNSEFQAVGELLAIERRTEATRQWWHAIAGLDSHQLSVAAKLAQYWQWPSMAIFTIAKAQHWDDTDLRFPLAFDHLIQDYAKQQQLDPALIFGLIRQESAFDEFAGSSAGAMGLMQLMPKTAKQIAGEFKEPWRNDFNLLIPAINIKYGSAYFKKILSRYDGHYALAIAAYNAGPNRIQQWLPSKHSLPADIWIETIPYKETRGYVSSVIMYAMIYQQRLLRSGLKVADLLADVKPG